MYFAAQPVRPTDASDFEPDGVAHLLTPIMA
jgi:hypothetical protein